MADHKILDNYKTYTDELFDTLREGFLMLDTDFKIVSANTAFCDLFNVEAENMKGKSLFELGDGIWDIPELRELLEQILPKDRSINDYEMEYEFPGIGHRIIHLNARRIESMRLILMAFEDATERIKAIRIGELAKSNLEQRVKDRTRQVHKLALQIAEIEQEERRRISQLLHDDLQQILFSVRLHLNLIQKKVSNNADYNPEEEISDVTEMVIHAIDKTRQLSHDLNPPVLKTKELSPILEWIAKRYDELYNLKTTVEIETDFVVRDDKVRTVLLKVVRELLFNIVKHAETDKALVKLINSEDNNLTIRVIDKGIGFDAEKIESTEGFGLFNIQERIKMLGGSFEVDVTPGSGCRMTVKLPVEDDILPTGNTK